jgi:hypothetical protein
MLFTAYVEQFLAPTLARGDIVILDDLGSHKGKAARAAIRRAGAHLLFLPPPASAGAGYTAPTSTRSNSSLPSSSTSCAKPRNEPIQPPGAASAPSSTSSPRRSAPITWLFQATLPPKHNML